MTEHEQFEELLSYVAELKRKDTLKEISSIASILGNLAVTYKVINDTK